MTNHDATYRSSRSARRGHGVLALVMALLPLWSSLAIALDFHAELSTRLSCAVCKSAADLCSVDQTAEVSLVVLESVRTAAFPETVLSAPWKIALPDTTRPPPAGRRA